VRHGFTPTADRPGQTRSVKPAPAVERSANAARYEALQVRHTVALANVRAVRTLATA